MSGTSAGLRLIEHGFAVLSTPLDLQPTASGTWTDTGLSVDLPAAGTYQLDATVRAAMTATTPANVWISARLVDATTGVVVPSSEAIIEQIQLSTSTGTISRAGNSTGSIHVEYTVAAPCTVRLEAQRTIAVGTTTEAGVYSTAVGRTTLRHHRIA